MKTLLLTLALLFNASLFASDYDYEITPQLGYNMAEGNLHLQDYKMFGAEIQYNGLDFFLKPELSFMTGIADYENGLPGYADTADTSVFRIALNGVYEFGKIASVTPLVKAGFGYENMDDPYTENTNSPFLDAGAGLKIPFNDNIALKLEALYILKSNDSRNDTNLALLAGLTIAFGEKAQKASPVVPVAAVIIAPVVAAAVAETPVVAVVPVIVDGDDDKDGVLNSEDKCPSSPEKAAVDTDGCPIVINLHVSFAFDSAIVNNHSSHDIQKFADFLTTYQNYNANIIGHTDSSGPSAYNQTLSEKRAHAVEKILLSKGVDSKRISSSGRGENSPSFSNNTKENRQKNRRIEANLIKR